MASTLDVNGELGRGASNSQLRLASAWCCIRCDSILFVALSSVSWAEKLANSQLNLSQHGTNKRKKKKS